MYPFSFSRSSRPAVTTVTATSRAAERLLQVREPSGAASRQIAVTSWAPAAEQQLDRRDERPAGGEHRVQHVDLPVRQVLGQPVGVRRRHQRRLVAHHAEEADLGGGQQPDHPLEHAEAGPQDRHDQRPRLRPAVRPTAGPPGSVTSYGTVRTSRVASYASSVTSSSASRRNVGESVRSSRSVVSLWATSGWSATWTRMARRLAAPGGRRRVGSRDVLHLCTGTEACHDARMADGRADGHGHRLRGGRATARTGGGSSRRCRRAPPTASTRSSTRCASSPARAARSASSRSADDFFVAVRVLGEDERILLSDVDRRRGLAARPRGARRARLPMPDEDDLDDGPAGRRPRRLRRPRRRRDGARDALRGRRPLPGRDARLASRPGSAFGEEFEQTLDAGSLGLSALARRPPYDDAMRARARRGRAGARRRRRPGRRRGARRRRRGDRPRPQRARGRRRPDRRTPRWSRCAPRREALGDAGGSTAAPSSSRSSRARCAPARRCSRGSARVVFGAYDPKAGAAGSLWDVVRDRRLNHRPEVVGGVLGRGVRRAAARLLRAPAGPAGRGAGKVPGGGVSERPKEHASKACEGATPPWVQIPPPPPHMTMPRRSRTGGASHGQGRPIGQQCADAVGDGTAVSAADACAGVFNDVNTSPRTKSTVASLRLSSTRSASRPGRRRPSRWPRRWVRSGSRAGPR